MRRTVFTLCCSIGITAVLLAGCMEKETKVQEQLAVQESTHTAYEENSLKTSQTVMDFCTFDEDGNPVVYTNQGGVVYGDNEWIHTEDTTEAGKKKDFTYISFVKATYLDKKWNEEDASWNAELKKQKINNVQELFQGYNGEMYGICRHVKKKDELTNKKESGKQESAMPEDMDFDLSCDLYKLGKDGSVTKIDTNAFNTKDDVRYMTAKVLEDNTMLILYSDKSIVRINLETGKKIQTYNGTYSTLNVVGDEMYVADAENGKVKVIDVDSEETVQTFSLDMTKTGAVFARDDSEELYGVTANGIFHVKENGIGTNGWSTEEVVSGDRFSIYALSGSTNVYLSALSCMENGFNVVYKTLDEGMAQVYSLYQYIK